MARILCISYDPALLSTRELLLKKLGYDVVSVEGFVKAYRACDEDGPFDLIVLGHSIPYDDKAEILTHCSKTCPCPVLALLRPHESACKRAAKSVDSGDPQAFIAAVRELVGG